MGVSGEGAVDIDAPEHQSVEQIRDLQLQRLRWSIRHAW